MTTTEDTVTIAELIGEPREPTRRELCAMDASKQRHWALMAERRWRADAQARVDELEAAIRAHQASVPGRHRRDADRRAVRGAGRRAMSATTATPIDPNPDLCWRCDARVACDDLGLCEPCREVLR